MCPCGKITELWTLSTTDCELDVLSLRGKAKHWALQGLPCVYYFRLCNGTAWMLSQKRQLSGTLLWKLLANWVLVPFDTNGCSARDFQTSSISTQHERLLFSFAFSCCDMRHNHKQHGKERVCFILENTGLHPGRKRQKPQRTSAIDLLPGSLPTALLI